MYVLQGHVPSIAGGKKQEASAACASKMQIRLMKVIEIPELF